MARRFSIVLILSLGFFYFFFTRDSDALAPIGLISFTAIAQFFPAVHRGPVLARCVAQGGDGGDCRRLRLLGLVQLPALVRVGVARRWRMLLKQGPWGISWLRPEAMFGLDGLDPLAHAAFWSLLGQCADR